MKIYKMFYIALLLMVALFISGCGEVLNQSGASTDTTAPTVALEFLAKLPGAAG